MLTEHEARSAIALILSLPLTPFAKARRLLRIGRRLRRQRADFSKAHSLSRSSDNRNDAAHFARLIRGMSDLYVRIRDHARELIQARSLQMA